MLRQQFGRLAQPGGEHVGQAADLRLAQFRRWLAPARGRAGGVGGQARSRGAGQEGPDQGARRRARHP
ncbi:hypothetical protein GCM10010215_30010 [Streptomyces virginiae]|uniref:Uncharacterized protein n=1 Tax=Streptomyces virginiae TaxID=1961 RepID=A0ABQ3NIY9_STRVG|nr:hypothetical protein GCM10010215_30010 [Streptomyces virginiae]GHI12717.1 hypothetical protein Scinn_21800 [Streptomyces virginiae]